MNILTIVVKNSKLIMISLTLFAFSLFIMWKLIQTEQQKLTLERQRIGLALRQVGIATAKIQPSLSQSTTHEDSMAPHELNDEAELAQAKLWQSMPKDKRAIMQKEMIQAGLTAFSNK